MISNMNIEFFHSYCAPRPIILARVTTYTKSFIDSNKVESSYSIRYFRIDISPFKGDAFDERRISFNGRGAFVIKVGKTFAKSVIAKSQKIDCPDQYAVGFALMGLALHD